MLTGLQQQFSQLPCGDWICGSGSGGRLQVRQGFGGTFLMYQYKSQQQLSGGVVGSGCLLQLPDVVCECVLITVPVEHATKQCAWSRLSEQS